MKDDGSSGLGQSQDTDRERGMNTSSEPAASAIQATDPRVRRVGDKQDWLWMRPEREESAEAESERILILGDGFAHPHPFLLRLRRALGAWDGRNAKPRIRGLYIPSCQPASAAGCSHFGLILDPSGERVDVSNWWGQTDRVARRFQRRLAEAVDLAEALWPESSPGLSRQTLPDLRVHLLVRNGAGKEAVGQARAYRLDGSWLTLHFGLPYDAWAGEKAQERRTKALRMSS